jgi:hypothetical protein
MQIFDHSFCFTYSNPEKFSEYTRIYAESGRVDFALVIASGTEQIPSGDLKRFGKLFWVTITPLNMEA